MPKSSIFRFAAPVVGALALIVIASPASGQVLEHEYLIPAMGTKTQRFGASLAVDGDVMVAGAPQEDTNAVNAGAAFVFRWDGLLDTWIEEQQLFPSDPEAGAQFGSSVGVSGDLIVVGAPLEDNTNGSNAGAFYVFRFDSVTGAWNQEQKLIENGGFNGNKFGAAISISGNVVVVGAPECNGASGWDSGCAFVFRYTGSSTLWIAEEMLVDPDSRSGDQASAAVAIEGDLVLVASPHSAEGGNVDAGSVAVWRRSGGIWSFDQELTASHQSTGDEFGLSVAVKDGLVIAGAPLEDHSASLVDAGAAYVFRHDGKSYVEEVRITHPSPGASQEFGSDVDIRGNLALVGASHDDDANSDAGAACTFRFARRTWAFDQPLGASDTAANDHFGGQVAMNATQMLVAAADNDKASGGNDWGAVYGYLAAEISLEITPSAPAAGAPLTFTAFPGTPNDLVITAVMDVNGASFFLTIFPDLFASNHIWSTTVSAPDPLFRFHVGFRSFKVGAAGPIVFSEMAYVDV
jgi:hypothetical protein